MRLIVMLLFLLTTSLTVQSRGLPRAEGCGSCHVSNFDTWEASAHADSISSRDFRSCLEDYLEEEGTDSGSYCLECHAPGEVISGDVFAATRDIVKGKVHRDGVTCVACHSVESIEEGKAVYDPGGINGYHSVKDLKSVDREALCLTCHSRYQSTSPVAEETGTGFFEGLYASLSGVVRIRNKTIIDHRFVESVVESEGHWECKASSKESLLGGGHQ